MRFSGTRLLCDNKMLHVLTDDVRNRAVGVAWTTVDIFFVKVNHDEASVFFL